MNPTQKIANLRNEIDKLDKHIVELLLKRFSNAKKIGKVKNMNAILGEYYDEYLSKYSAGFWNLLWAVPLLFGFFLGVYECNGH